MLIPVELIIDCKATIVSFDMVHYLFQEIWETWCLCCILPNFLSTRTAFIAAARTCRTRIMFRSDMGNKERTRFLNQTYHVWSWRPITIQEPSWVLEQEWTFFFVTAETHQLVLYNTDNHEIRDQLHQILEYSGLPQTMMRSNKFKWEYSSI